MSKILLFFASIFSTILGANHNYLPSTTPITTPSEISADTRQIKMLKDVGEAYMDYFGLTEADFKNMSEGGFNLIEGNFDICASDGDVSYFLDMSNKYNMKVILPAGAGEAEWSYECDQEPYPADQRPVWDASSVERFVNKWKNHPALYGWDSSNEAGSTLPNVESGYYLNTEQLQTAYEDIKSWDPVHPVMIRMNGWFFYDYNSDFFKTGNPYGTNIADIVMINSYSNVEDYYSDFVSTTVSRAISSITAINSNTQFIVSLGVWEEPPLWYLPSVSQLETDLGQLAKFDVLGVAYFKYGATGSEWYLPQSATAIWNRIRQ